MCAKTIETKDITYDKLLQGNKDWVKDMIDKDPAFFDKLSAGQSPPVLWIGCSDSRVPANQITNTKPGDIFVHRNIANVVVHTDMNMLSVLDYSVNVLKVKHVIVCGHYGCGGVKAALGNKQVGIIDNWLRNIRDVYRMNEGEMAAIEDADQRFDRLVELNAIQGASNVMNTSIVQTAWSKGQELAVHAWVYSLQTGIIKDMEVTCTCLDDVTPAFKVG
ncbi:carbonic anhydrase [Pedobacter sp. Leaf194]|uniref:carbonic anhydrase n=1 Tax=Pedobacter sp. Leaf194 TaxID=1736297 RepID=UPI0007025A5D|nr:carbonic anhydrase [Pedobacter sp. Leaf194]KQS41677.1 carbonate dehydratase [Pedobacter sp. Leaf194]RZK91418.1 MAG: carbonic anhydrase [Pedobacter sp.]